MECMTLDLLVQDEQHQRFHVIFLPNQGQKTQHLKVRSQYKVM